MKKISREFWVNSSMINNLKIVTIFATEKSAYENIKITISWEEPSKVITISEEEFDHIVNEYNSQDCAWDFREYLKQKLFRDEV